MVCWWYIEKFLVGHKSLSFPWWKVSSIKKFVEVESSVCLVGQALEERALAWSSPFKLAKMITIWPQNRCISPGLAGNRDFVFPFEWPVSIHRAPPMSALARGPNYYFGPQASVLFKGFCSKKNFFFWNERHICYCGWLFGQKVIVRCPPRCLVSSWKPAPRWSGGSTQAGTRMIRD